jgi:hypothetical protein
MARVAALILARRGIRGVQTMSIEDYEPGLGAPDGC